MSTRTIITNAEVQGRSATVVIEGDSIVSITESGDVASLRDRDDEVRIDAAGGALLPGLHDHHVHLMAMAARRDGVDVDSCATAAEFDDVVKAGVNDVDGDWVRVAGYDEHRHGVLSADRLDALIGARKVRVQHRSGLAWVLSSAGLDEVLVGERPDGVEVDDEGAPTGRLLRLDEWLASRIGVRSPSFDGLGAELAAFGITGVTDATPRLGEGRITVLREAVLTGALPQRLVLLGADEVEIGPATGESSGWAEIGPAKMVIDEVTGLDPDAIAERISEHHANHRAVAIHAVSRAETVTAVTALALAGPMRGDRIEHGSVLPKDLDAVLTRGGVTVIVQPRLIFERGDHYLDGVDGVDENDLPILHRARSLIDAGVSVAVGSDAPVTTPDPWAAIAAASTRTTRSGHVLGTDEVVDARVALGWYLADPLQPASGPRPLRVGGRADLCLLDAPLEQILIDPDASHVRMTWVGGRLVHS